MLNFYYLILNFYFFRHIINYTKLLYYLYTLLYNKKFVLSSLIKYYYKFIAKIILIDIDNLDMI